MLMKDIDIQNINFLNIVISSTLWDNSILKSTRKSSVFQFQVSFFVTKLYFLPTTAISQVNVPNPLYLKSKLWKDMYQQRVANICQTSLLLSWSWRPPRRMQNHKRKTCIYQRKFFILLFCISEAKESNVNSMKNHVQVYCSSKQKSLFTLYYQ